MKRSILLDRSGRLTIPPDMLALPGIQAGERVTVTADKTGLRVVSRRSVVASMVGKFKRPNSPRKAALRAAETTSQPPTTTVSATISPAGQAMAPSHTTASKGVGNDGA